MNTRDQFGNYLLLKRLGEDGLGEIFRAGKVGGGALERVVLLRVLNGQGFDADRVARALQARAGLAQALKSPNIGQATDVGQVRGVPYAAYDYSSGRSLAQLLEQATRRNSPLPLDHALLVAERIALALAVAFETRFAGDRVQHGFVVPPFVHVSNEGELKLLGFETSTGLSESVAHPIVKQAFGRYLAPEVVAGQPGSRADDVYSLGALLFEMITAQQVPMMPAGGFGAALDQMVSAADGSAPPAELLTLLKRTLCPRDQRVPDVVTWHKSVAKMMADSGLAATTFNLAFFLHNLYREEIDREGRELETEKNQAESMIAAAAAPAVETTQPSASPVSASGPVREDTSVLRDAYGLPPKRSGNSAVLIGAGVGAVLILATVGYFVLGRDAAPAPTAEPAPVETTAPAPVAAEPEPAAPAVPAGPTPEELQAQIAQMVTQQSQQLQAGLKAQYDEQLKTLQRQLDEAQKASTAPAPAAPAPARIDSLPGAAATNSVQNAAQPAPQPATPAPQPAAPAKKTDEPAPRPAPATAQPAAKSPAQPAPAPAQSVPEAGGVRQGDLVSPGAGVTAPRVVRAPSPSYPALAKRMKREATVTVRVLVDENGRPSQAQLSGKKVGFGLDEAALDYANGCIFEPAKKNGIKVKMWYDLQVAFTLGG